MENDAQVLELLEKMLDSGSTPEEVCADYPDLLPVLREQWAQCRRLEVEIDDLFPSSDSTLLDDPSIPDGPTNLPHIPGYEVELVLGRGGMGIVHKARHLRLGRTIALKMLLSGAYASRAIGLHRFVDAV